MRSRGCCSWLIIYLTCTHKIRKATNEPFLFLLKKSGILFFPTTFGKSISPKLNLCISVLWHLIAQKKERWTLKRCQEKLHFWLIEAPQFWTVTCVFQITLFIRDKQCFLISSWIINLFSVELGFANIIKSRLPRIPPLPQICLLLDRTRENS